MEHAAGVCAPVGHRDVVAPGSMRRSSPTHRFGYGLSASLAISVFTRLYIDSSRVFSLVFLP